MDPSFTHDAAAALAVRGSRKVEDTGYQFTRDLQLKAVRTLLYVDSVQIYLRLITCSLLTDCKAGNF